MLKSALAAGVPVDTGSHDRALGFESDEESVRADRANCRMRSEGDRRY